jgi:hypothetical protein
MIRTLDVILFSGTDWWPSKLFEWLTWSNYSHVAIGAKDPTYVDSRLVGEYIIESGEESVPGAVSGTLRWGVQIQRWDEIIQGYPGRVFVRRFSWESAFQPEQDKIEEELARLWKDTRHSGYDTNVIDLIEARFGVDIRGRQTKEFICSAYAACILCCIGAIPSDVDWDAFMPCDFVPGGKVDKLLSKKGMASLGPLVQLK